MSSRQLIFKTKFKVMVTISFCLAEQLLIYDRAKTDSEGSWSGRSHVPNLGLVWAGNVSCIVSLSFCLVLKLGVYSPQASL